MSFLNKYKEINPKATVENIKNFFNKRNYIIQENNIINNEIDTWSCNLHLFYNDILILSCNGKGISKDFCLASGYAELYERFCNRCGVKNNLFFMKESLPHKKNVKQIKDFSENYLVKKYFEKILPKEEQNLYFQNFLLNHLYEDSYINILDNKISYFDERIIEHLFGSCGMAAGNTIEEALNQGISEICEKTACHNFFLTPPETFYIIKEENVKNIELKNKINNIKNLGYDFYIFDLSYNYELPVLMSLLVDPNNYTMRVNFGSFPVFDIALERIITELYQGVQSFKSILKQIEIPYNKEKSKNILKENADGITSASYFREDFLIHSLFVDMNKEIFLSENNGPYSNQDILNYYKELSIKNKINFFYIDNSLCEEIKAVQCFSPDLNYYTPAIHRINYSSNIFKKSQLNFSYMFLKVAYGILLNDTDENILCSIKHLLDYIDKNERDSILLGFLLKRDPLAPIETRVKMPLEFYLFSLPNLIEDSFENSIFYKNARKFSFIQRYASEKYSFLEIKNIFNQIFKEDINEEDFKYCYNKDYLIKEIYIKPIKAFIQDELYTNYVSTYFN